MPDIRDTFISYWKVLNAREGGLVDLGMGMPAASVLSPELAAPEALARGLSDREEYQHYADYSVKGTLYGDSDFGVKNRICGRTAWGFQADVVSGGQEVAPYSVDDAMQEVHDTKSV